MARQSSPYILSLDGENIMRRNHRIMLSIINSKDLSLQAVFVSSKNWQDTGFIRGPGMLVGLENLSTEMFVKIYPCPTIYKGGKWATQRRNSLSEATQLANGELGPESRYPDILVTVPSYFHYTLGENGDEHYGQWIYACILALTLSRYIIWEISSDSLRLFPQSVN